MLYDINNNKFIDFKTGDEISKTRQKELLNNKELMRAIDKAKKMLGE